jgi:hypothetical protein
MHIPILDISESLEALAMQSYKGKGKAAIQKRPASMSDLPLLLSIT